MKEFEEKRGDREVESVFKVLETVTELNGGEIDKVQAQCDSTLPNLKERLTAANSLCTKILDQERRLRPASQTDLNGIYKSLSRINCTFVMHRHCASKYNVTQLPI